GSSAGFKKFIPGETDFSDASRAIKAEEITQLEEKGLKYGEDVYEFKLALDGLTFVINKDNTWAQAMTKEEVVDMYLSGTHKADDKVLWSDVRADWPAEQINFYGPNENHGTYEFFYENILGKKDLVTTVNLQQEYSTLVDMVSKDKNAIAFFGFGYYVSNKDKITAVKIDFGSGPVDPTLETIGEDLPYAGFTRPVFTYLNVKYAKEKPQVLDFAKYIVSSEGAAKLAGENGFAPLPKAEYDAYLQKLAALG
ncbi:MAG: substrate-binding domain-containing protein, partial [Bacillota bacterium]|nr:substrate-binding domain-containing protein [Bacillota bacterium]